MELHNLKPAEGSTKARKVLGRGTGSGRGRTSTRGHKGAKSRSGFKNKRHFEGGQTPLQMRLPKFGFNSPNRVEYFPVNLDLLQHFCEKFSIDEISYEFLVEKRIVKKYHKIKVLGRGELTSVVNVQVHAISDSAKNHIEKMGGKVTLL